MGSKRSQYHAGPVVGERLSGIRLERFGIFAGQAVDRGPVKLMREQRDGPAAVLLAHRQQPVKAFLDPASSTYPAWMSSDRMAPV